MVGTKKDLKNHDGIINDPEGLENKMVKIHGRKEVSAKTGHNVEDLFKEVIKTLIEKSDPMDMPLFKKGTTRLMVNTENITEKSSCGCKN